MTLVNDQSSAAAGSRAGGDTRGFALSIIRGLAAGDVTGAVLAGLFSTFMEVSEAGSLGGSVALMLRMMLMVGGVGAIASVFPLGPLAALLARRPYLRGVRSQVFYGIMGAATSLALPIGVIAFYLIEEAPYDAPSFTADDAYWFLLDGLWFAISGAAGGIVFARSIRSYDPKDLRDVALVF